MKTINTFKFKAEYSICDNDGMYNWEKKTAYARTKREMKKQIEQYNFLAEYENKVIVWHRVTLTEEYTMEDFLA